MPYMITSTNLKGRTSFWQTPWASRDRVVDAEGNATYDSQGHPVFKVDRDGKPAYKQIGGWCSKPEYATLYDEQDEAAAVSDLRGLHGDVVEV